MLGLFSKINDMTINRRRAPSSKISSEKKKAGHENEVTFAELIGGEVKKGIRKGDVLDRSGNLHSVKQGKKWQIFLYTLGRISKCSYLNILKPCIESFPDDYDLYLKDRISCISYKETFKKKHGNEAAKLLTNDDVTKSIGDNVYVNAKYLLKKETEIVSNLLQDKIVLKNFYKEAIFNNNEVNFFTIKDTHYKKDGLFKVFTKDDVLDVLTELTFPSVSVAGRVAIDFNVPGQKTLLRYKNPNEKYRNIVEIEVRNETKIKYRLLRFNMKSRDALYLLCKLPNKKLNDKIQTFGQANEKFTLDV